jgi:hypothetical protein
LLVKRQVLVNHGVANHEPSGFFKNVEHLSGQFPSLQFLKVFWGDVGGDMRGLDDTVPPAVDDHRSDEALRRQLASEDAAEPAAIENQNWAAVMSAAGHNEATAGLGLIAESSVPTEEELQTLIEEASAELVHLPHIRSQSVLQQAGRILGRALREARPQSVAEGIEASLQWPGFVHDLLHQIDGLVGEVLGTSAGQLNQLVRGKLLPFFSSGIGDAFVYQRHVRKVQARLNKQLAVARKIDAGYGTQAQPIDVVAHSLGGLIAFDAAVSPAMRPNLWIRNLITFGTQVSAFEVFDHRGRGLPAYVPSTPSTPPISVNLPTTIGTWTNLWEPMDPLAFRMKNVFKLAAGEIQEEFVPHLLSAGLWTHSAYWTSDQLKQAIAERIVAAA